MPMYKNNTASPRVLHLKGGGSFLLEPNKPSPDVTLARGPDEDPVLKAWLDEKHIEEVSAAQVKKDAKSEAQELAELQAHLVETQAKIARLMESQRAAELDQNRRTVPHQLGGDGGPQQVGTADGRGGALTPNQAQGRPEMPPDQQAHASALRRAAEADRAARAEAEAKHGPKGGR